MAEKLNWERSSHCANSNCAEVASDGQFVYLRNSRLPDLVVTLDLDEWAAFTAGIRNGELPLPGAGGRSG